MSLRFGILAIGAIYANGDKKWCKRGSIGANGDGFNGANGAPIANGANDNHHWWSMVPFNWLH